MLSIVGALQRDGTELEALFVSLRVRACGACIACGACDAWVGCVAGCLGGNMLLLFCNVGAGAGARERRAPSASRVAGAEARFVGEARFLLLAVVGRRFVGEAARFRLLAVVGRPARRSSCSVLALGRRRVSRLSGRGKTD